MDRSTCKSHLRSRSRRGPVHWRDRSSRRSRSRGCKDSDRGGWSKSGNGRERDRRCRSRSRDLNERLPLARPRKGSIAGVVDRGHSGHGGYGKNDYSPRGACTDDRRRSHDDGSNGEQAPATRAKEPPATRAKAKPKEQPPPGKSTPPERPLSPARRVGDFTVAKAAPVRFATAKSAGAMPPIPASSSALPKPAPTPSMSVQTPVPRPSSSRPSTTVAKSSLPPRNHVPLPTPSQAVSAADEETGRSASHHGAPPFLVDQSAESGFGSDASDASQNTDAVPLFQNEKLALPPMRAVPKQRTMSKRASPPPPSESVLSSRGQAEEETLDTQHHLEAEGVALCNAVDEADARLWGFEIGRRGSFASRSRLLAIRSAGAEKSATASGGRHSDGETRAPDPQYFRSLSTGSLRGHVGPGDTSSGVFATWTPTSLVGPDSASQPGAERAPYSGISEPSKHSKPPEAPSRTSTDSSTTTPGVGESEVLPAVTKKEKERLRLTVASEFNAILQSLRKNKKLPEAEFNAICQSLTERTERERLPAEEFNAICMSRRLKPQILFSRQKGHTWRCTIAIPALDLKAESEGGAKALAKFAAMESMLPSLRTACPPPKGKAARRRAFKKLRSEMELLPTDDDNRDMENASDGSDATGKGDETLGDVWSLVL